MKIDESIPLEDKLHLPSWAQNVIVSILLCCVVHFIILPRLRRGHSRGGGSGASAFEGSGEVLEKDWSARKESSRSRLLNEFQASATDADTSKSRDGPVERKDEDEKLSSNGSVPSSETQPDTQTMKKDAPGAPAPQKQIKSEPATRQAGRSRQQRRLDPPVARTERTRPKFKSKAEHPGLGGFCVWHDAISEIYRSYTIGKTDGSTPALPIIPRSERGNVPIHLEATNRTSAPFDVFWIDYLGREEYKGSAEPGSTWFQQTWIGHPWTFRAQGGKVLLHYVPFRVIQTTARVLTVNARNEGIQRFTILSPSYEFQAKNYICDVDDPIFPYPSDTKFKSPQEAFDWSCSHMEREGSSPRAVLKYLCNVLKNPDEPKYRQIRTANKTFWNDVWITAARGMLHALGFEENGAYVEIGPEDGALPAERIEQISRAVSSLEAILLEIEGPNSGTAVTQPAGADGFGRAGFGRIGMN